MAIPKTPAMVLQELCVKKHLAHPQFEIINSIAGTHINRFDYEVYAGDVIGRGTGSSKQISKHEAALDALRKLQIAGIYDPIEMPVSEFKPNPSDNNISSPKPKGIVMKATPNCIGPLKELCFENKISEPSFVLLGEVGPPHAKEFTYECCVASLKTMSTSSTKKLAKQFAAQEMLEKLKKVLPEIAASCQADVETKLPALSEIENEVLRRYNETYSSVVANKTCKIEDYPLTLKNLMNEHCKTIDEFTADLQLRNIEALERILTTLHVEHEFLSIQDNPTLVALIVKIDTPLTAIGIGNSESTARADALDQVFDILECFMNLL